MPVQVRGFRLIPPIETYPRIRRFAETVSGRIVLVAVFTAGLWASRRPYSLEIGLLLLAISAFPRYRAGLAAFGTVYWLARHHGWLGADLIYRVALAEGPAAGFTAGKSFLAAMLGLTLASCTLIVWSLRRNRTVAGLPAHWILYGGYAGMVLAIASVPVAGPLRVALWAIALISGKYLYWLAYAVQAPPVPAPGSRLLDVASMRPFWMSGSPMGFTPIPKGGANLQRIEATDPGQLAVAQLKGLKLLAWALLLAQLASLSERLPALGVIPLDRVFELSIANAPLPWHVGWLSMVSTFLFDIVGVAVSGHLVVACVRVAGFHAPRNTYRPLSATTVAEFWNRYLYYYKELLVDHFFMPAYRRWFRGRPRVRLVAATFAAACFGNCYAHFFGWYMDPLAQGGVRFALQRFEVFALYGVLLATGISVSQLRRRCQPAAELSPARRVLATTLVLLFFCVIRVFGSFDSKYNLSDHFVFLGSLIPGAGQ